MNAYRSQRLQGMIILKYSCFIELVICECTSELVQASVVKASVRQFGECMDVTGEEFLTEVLNVTVINT
jgi:hypothetical protein